MKARYIGKSGLFIEQCNYWHEPTFIYFGNDIYIWQLTLPPPDFKTNDMREIKFRGKREDNGEWVYGYYGTNGSGWHWIFVPISENDVHSFKFIRVIPDSVGQYTGLKDKNGKDIYEGDITNLTTPSDDYYRINKGVEKVAVSFEKSMWCFGKWDMSATYYFGKLKNEQIEIIGSVFDNPELLTTPQGE